MYAAVHIIFDDAARFNIHSIRNFHFNVRHHVDRAMIYHFRPSVRLSVRPMLVFCRNVCTIRQTSFIIWALILDFLRKNICTNFEGQHHQWGVKYRGWKNLRFRRQQHETVPPLMERHAFVRRTCLSSAPWTSLSASCLFNHRSYSSKADFSRSLACIVCQRTTSNIGIPTNNSIINWMKTIITEGLCTLEMQIVGSTTAHQNTL